MSYLGRILHQKFRTLCITLNKRISYQISIFDHIHCFNELKIKYQSILLKHPTLILQDYSQTYFAQIRITLFSTIGPLSLSRTTKRDAYISKLLKKIYAIRIMTSYR